MTRVEKCLKELNEIDIMENYALKILKSRLISWNSALKDKEWASSGSESDKNQRNQMKLEIIQLKEAIEILKIKL